jgi:superfamily II RNA helicase
LNVSAIAINAAVRNAAPLAALLPKPGEPALAPNEILDRFVSFVSSTGLSLYPAQEEAILELLSGKHLILNTPTGSGKSLVATALHFKSMCEGRVSFYTCPIKALVNEKFFALCDAFGPENVGMMTGDATINRDAPIICCTAEILSNMALRDAEPRVDDVVMDEFHYYADKERGVAWQVPLLALNRSTFLLMSATLGDMTAIEESLRQLTGREVAVVRSSERPVPLDHEYRETPLHETLEDLLAARKYPVYLVNFTQRAAAEQAQNLLSVNFSTADEKEQIREALFDARFDTPYGKDFQKLLRHGLGLHHAGLLPRYRLWVEKLSQTGLLKVISGTDTLGVGVNIPIRTVLFTQLCKFDGEKVGILSVRDFQQIAGRAGRKGFDERGSVVVQAPEHVIENIRIAQRIASGKKMVKKQPPPKGFVAWDRNTFQRLSTQPPEPLQSRFEVTHGLLLNLLQSSGSGRAGGYRRLVELIRRSHGRDYDRRQRLKTAALRFRTLRGAGLVEVIRARDGEPAHVAVAPGLQRDFSLNHTLSLYLLAALESLDATAETHALDVLTLVESILEDPDVVLYSQLHRLKDAKIAELKAQGVEYEQRMEELEKLEWPKPLREFIYATFNEFAQKHPWVGEENIRPKSVVREIVERFCSFNDYIRDYGLQRSEGVLLRYLGQVYKTLIQTVPEPLKTEPLDDIVSYLRAMIRQVDSSLLEEWESLKNPLEARPGEHFAKADQPADPSADPKAFRARLRVGMQQLLRALAAKNYDEAAASIFQPEGEWTPARLEEEMEPYWREHASIDVTPRARQPIHTTLKQQGPRQWEVQQRILDPEGDDDWMLDCSVDLTVNRPIDAPLIHLMRIGT